jgi:hypothetical protein
LRKSVVAVLVANRAFYLGDDVLLIRPRLSKQHCQQATLARDHNLVTHQNVELPPFPHFDFWIDSQLVFDGGSVTRYFGTVRCSCRAMNYFDFHPISLFCFTHCNAKVQGAAEVVSGNQSQSWISPKNKQSPFDFQKGFHLPSNVFQQLLAVPIQVQCEPAGNQ